MRINFPTNGGPHLASYRMRIMQPAQFLRSKGHQVYIGAYKPDCDIHVFSKHWNKKDDLKHARQSPCPVFDICDDHFSDQHGDYYRAMTDLCHVICSSPGLAKIAGKGAVIPEAYELKGGDIRIPTEKKVLWYGHWCNSQPMLDLLPSLDDWEVRMVTNQSYQRIRNVELREWSLTELQASLTWCHVVLIPVPEGKNPGPNRVVEAIHAGRSVVASDIPDYRDFGVYLGANKDLPAGLSAVLGRGNLTPETQQRVRDTYSPERIGTLWLNALSTLHALSLASRKNLPSMQ